MEYVKTKCVTAKFATGITCPVLEDTTVYPSNSIYVRSYMEIYADDNAITREEFENIVSNTDNTSKITISITKAHYDVDENGNETEIENSASDMVQTYARYTDLVDVGIKTLQKINEQTGELIRERRLYAKLEQPTYIEQQFAQLQNN